MDTILSGLVILLGVFGFAGFLAWLQAIEERQARVRAQERAQQKKDRRPW